MPSRSSACFALWWIVAFHATDIYLGGNNKPVPRSVSSTTILGDALKRNRYYLADMVGVFGWFDTYSPTATFVIWGLLAGGAFGLAVARVGKRAVVLIGAVIGTVVIPALIVTSHAHVDGYTWSGRDGMPLAVGVPILATALVGHAATRPPAAAGASGGADGRRPGGCRPVPRLLRVAPAVRGGHDRSDFRFPLPSVVAAGDQQHRRRSWRRRLHLVALSALYLWSAWRVGQAEATPDAAEAAGPVTVDRGGRSSVSEGSNRGGTQQWRT